MYIIRLLAVSFAISEKKSREKSGIWSDIVQFGRWCDGVTALAQLHALCSDKVGSFN